MNKRGRLKAIYNVVTVTLLTLVVVIAASVLLDYYVSLLKISNRQAIYSLATLKPLSIKGGFFSNVKANYEINVGRVNVTYVGLFVAVPNVVRFKTGCIRFEGNDVGVRAGSPGSNRDVLVVSGLRNRALLCGNVVAGMVDNCTILIKIYNITRVNINSNIMNKKVLNTKYIFSLYYINSKFIKKFIINWPWVDAVNVYISGSIPSYSGNDLKFYKRYLNIQCKEHRFTIIVISHNYELVFNK